MVAARIWFRRCFCRRGRLLRALFIAAAVVSSWVYYSRHLSTVNGWESWVTVDGRHANPAAADVAAACAATSPILRAPADGLRHIVHYNVLNGIHDLERRHRLCEWLRAQHADVVTFNELNFWEQADLEMFGRECGFEHALLLRTNSPYRVGALSRSDPIVLVGKYLKGFGHGALHFATGGWHFVITHLTPLGGQAGLAEARRLLENINNSSLPVDTPLLILGDLNCLSAHDADRYDELHLASVLYKEKIVTGKSKHGLAAKFLTKDGKAVNYNIFEQFMVAGFADLRPAPTTAPPWQLPRTAKSKLSLSSSNTKWPSQSVPTSLHDDAMHAAPMRLDYALANAAAQRRMRSSPENWHAGPVQTLFTDTLSDHFPLQVLLCEDGTPNCASKIQARLEARAGMEARLDCDSDGWNKWRLRRVIAAQHAAQEAVRKRFVIATDARPSTLAEAQAVASARRNGGRDTGDGSTGESTVDVRDRHIQTVIDWTDPLLWRPAPRSVAPAPTHASSIENVQIERGWKVVRVRGRPGASCTQVCLDEGRRRRGPGPLQQHPQQDRSSSHVVQTASTATTTPATADVTGLGASRRVPDGFELKSEEGRLRRGSRRLAEHYDHSTSLFGHQFNITKLKELEQLEHEKLPQTDLVAEVALAGAKNSGHPAILWESGKVRDRVPVEEDCLVNETHGFCANGGQCIHLFGGAACACEHGFGGHHCDEVVDLEAGRESEFHSDHGYQRLVDSISRVKSQGDDADRVLKAEILSGARGPEAKALVMEVTDTTGAMTRERISALLRKAASGAVAVDLDVLLLARTLAIQRLPVAEQQLISSEQAQHLHTPGSGAASQHKRVAPAVPPQTEWDWQCSAKQIKVSNDCEQMTAEFGCANGCRLAPFGYPVSGDPAPSFSSWEGDMLPQVCILSGSEASALASDAQADGAPAPPEQETVAAGCTYGPPLVGKFLPGCVDNCKAHPALEQALTVCSKKNACGGVTKSADQGQVGYQLRASTAAQEQPSDPTSSEREISWVKRECEGGNGGLYDLCAKKDLFGRAQRLCSCVAPTTA